MDVVVLISFIVYIFLAMLIGSISRNRGHGYALGFWVSILGSPLIGLLVVIALGSKSNQTANAATMTFNVAARKWAELEYSRDLIKLAAFVDAFPGSEQAYLASEHRRQLESWLAVDKTDAERVALFLNDPDFAWLRNDIREAIAESASSNSDMQTLDQEILGSEEATREAAKQEAEEQQAKSGKSRAENERLRLARIDQAIATRRLNQRILVVGASLLLVVIVAHISFDGYTAWDRKRQFAAAVDAAKQAMVNKAAECSELQSRVSAAQDLDNATNEILNAEIETKGAQLKQLQKDFDSRVNDQIETLVTNAANNIKITAQHAGSFGTDYYVTVKNGTSFCISDKASVPVDLIQSDKRVGGFSFGKGWPSAQFENEKDRYGFEKPCIVSPGRSVRSKSSVDLGNDVGPNERVRAEQQGLRIINNKSYGIDFGSRFAFDRLNFWPFDMAEHLVELKQERVGNSVKWTASPVDWHGLAIAKLAPRQKALDALTATLEDLNGKLSATETHIAVSALQDDLASCRSDEKNLIQALYDRRAEQTAGEVAPVEAAPSEAPLAKTPSGYSGSACRASAQARLESCLYGPESTWGRCRTNYLSALERC